MKRKRWRKTLDERKTYRAISKPIRIAAYTQRYVNRLWEMGVDTSRYAASMERLLTSVFRTLTGAITRLATVGNRMTELSMTGFAPLPPLDIWSRQDQMEQDVKTQTGRMGGVNVSLLFRVSVARKIASAMAQQMVHLVPGAVQETPSKDFQVGDITGSQGLAGLVSQSRPSQATRRVSSSIMELEEGINEPLSVAERAGRQIGNAALLAGAISSTVMAGIPAFPGTPASDGETAERKQSDGKEVEMKKPQLGTEKTPVSPLTVAASQLVMPLTRLGSGLQGDLGSPISITGGEIPPEDTRNVSAKQPSSEERRYISGTETEEDKTRAIVPEILAPSMAMARLQGQIGRELSSLKEIGSEGQETQLPVIPVDFRAPAETRPSPVSRPREAGPGLLSLETALASEIEHHFTKMAQNIEVTQREYLRPLANIAVSGPPVTATMPPVSTSPSTAAQATVQREEEQPSRPVLRPVRPTRERDVNLVVSGEVQEEDLRDLERKISRIMTEQVRRHYGHISFEEI